MTRASDKKNTADRLSEDATSEEALARAVAKVAKNSITDSPTSVQLANVDVKIEANSTKASPSPLHPVRGTDLSYDIHAAQMNEMEVIKHASTRKPAVAKSTITVFCVPNKSHTVCSSKESAALFRMDWDGFISCEKTFKNMQEVNAFVATLTPPSPPGTPVKAVVDVDAVPVSSPGGEARYSAGIAKIQAAKPCNRVYFRTKTNSETSKCITVIEFLNYSGGPQWNDFSLIRQTKKLL